MIDDMGNLIYPGHDYGNPKYPGSIDNGAIDVEHSPIFYTTKTERICAQDERFASVNEAIGRLEYNLEQHIEKCADGLAPLADFITSSWAVIDEYGARLEALEKAQRPHYLTPPNVNGWIAQNNPPFAAAAHPPEGDWAHIPAAEWEAIVEELEWLRNQRAVMDDDGVLLSHDAWDAVERELHELQAFKAGVPWTAIAAAVNGAANVYAAADADIAEASAWLAASAPKGAWA